MDTASLLLLALGLAADATAAAATRGLAVAHVQLRHVLSVMAWFGLFQGGMTLAGSALGTTFGPYLTAWDHWLAFFVLAGLGAKMLWEARAPAEAVRSEQAFAFRTMLLLALATSIDALAVGVTLPLLGANVARACLLIAGVTALMSALGLWAGRRFGSLLGRRVDALGGLILIALGVEILIEHLG